jgi:hypothetical protein
VVRTPVPDTLWRLICKYAEENDLEQLQAWRLFLKRIVALIDEGNYDFMGPEFAGTLKRMISNDEIGVLGLPPIDVTKLHRSARTKSGFVGVYANGKGYRAEGAAPGAGTKKGTVNLGTYPTAEQAAWARYLHHKKHKITYGELDERMAYWRKAHPEMTDAEIVALIDELNIEQPSLGDLHKEQGLEPSQERPQGVMKIVPFGNIDPALFGPED